MSWTTDAMWAQSTARQAELHQDAENWRRVRAARSQRSRRGRGLSRLRKALSRRPSTA